MSTPEDKTGPTQPRSAEVWDDDIDVLEAMLFAQAHPTSLTGPAKGEASNDRGDATENAEADEDTQVRESPAVIERRLAMAREFKELASLGEGGRVANPRSVEPATQKAADGNARDSLITVPPATHSVPPVAIPALPIVVISDAAPDATVRLALTARVFAAALKARVFAATLTLRESSLRRGSWATWMITIAVALPGGLLLGHALSSHQTAVGTVESAAGASQAPPEPDPLTTGADSASQPSSAIPPTTDVAAATSSAQSPVYSDGPALVIMPRPSHHGRRRSAPKPADSSRSAGSSASASPVSSVPAH